MIYLELMLLPAYYKISMHDFFQWKASASSLMKCIHSHDHLLSGKRIRSGLSVPRTSFLFSWRKQLPIISNWPLRGTKKVTLNVSAPVLKFDSANSTDVSVFQLKYTRIYSYNSVALKFLLCRLLLVGGYVRHTPGLSIRTAVTSEAGG